MHADSPRTFPTNMDTIRIRIVKRESRCLCFILGTISINQTTAVKHEYPPLDLRLKQLKNVLIERSSEWNLFVISVGFQDTPQTNRRVVHIIPQLTLFPFQLSYIRERTVGIGEIQSVTHHPDIRDLKPKIVDRDFEAIALLLHEYASI